MWVVLRSVGRRLHGAVSVRVRVLKYIVLLLKINICNAHLCVLPPPTLPLCTMPFIGSNGVFIRCIYVLLRSAEVYKMNVAEVVCMRTYGKMDVVVVVVLVFFSKAKGYTLPRVG